MAVRLLGWVVAGATMAGCADGYVIVHEAAPPERGMSAAVVDDIEAVPEAARVLVTADKNIGRPTEVLGVLDFHTRAESEDKGFDQLRARAAAMGADAVIGAEFEHGEGNEPSHLSGMVVRFR